VYTCYENEDLYFIYRNISYCKGTEISLTNSFIQKNSYEGNAIWKYARFCKRIVKDGKNMYFFARCPVDWYWMRENNLSRKTFEQTCPYFLIDDARMSNAIESIIKPIEIAVLPLPQYKDYEVAGVMVGWVIYLLVLFFSLIFKEFYLIWIVASIIFFSVRKGMLNK
jgi:hypothetical protein